MLLENKVVIITGVGPGMGRNLAQIAAREGASVVLAARSAEFLTDVLTEIRDAGGTGITVPTDVADSGQCEQLISAALNRFGRIDGLINSAYRPATFTSFEDASIDSWQANMNVTCFGALRTIKAVLPAMKRQHSGAIVNITALAAAQPAAGQADYATAKTALEGATRQLAKEFGPYNIRVNSARMGWLWGAPAQHYLEQQAAASGVPLQDVIAPIASRIALGVIPPDEECAKAALFFVSDYSLMVTGTTLDVNGGEYFSS
jgi:NAD(P)-dependent dehydrogenase (short-subunit alcohol dehydrogenase family)